jgi:glycosyltransferase involved in cell wall biosynthesis
MPVHNAEKTLRTALRSTLSAMGRGDRLHIFLDDCSDDSFEILHRTIDERILIVGQSMERVGVKEALNKLIDSVESKYISRMDADDIMFPWRLKKQKQLLRKYDFVFSTAVVFGKALRPLPVLPQLPIKLAGFASQAALLFGNPFVHPSMSARTAAIVELGGYTEDFAQDFGLWLRASLRDYSFFRDPAPSIAYRFHPGQVSSTKAWFDSRDSDRVISQLQGKLERKLAKQHKLAGKSQILDVLYKEVPLLRIEHKGLPASLRKWKDAKRYRK